MILHKMIQTVLSCSGMPPLYEPGTKNIWTDSHISMKMLEAHLDPHLDAASRRHDYIKQSVEWITSRFGRGSGTALLDLGCGPGLYCRLFAERDFWVTGIDFSSRSIGFAQNNETGKTPSVDYICSNYLEIDYSEQFDIIILIYCDFPVLSPRDQHILLNKVYRALKPGGVFIFDVFTGVHSKYKSTKKSWEVCESGFFRPVPYLCLKETFHYPEDFIYLEQYIVIGADENIDIFRVWDQYFTQERLITLLEGHSFQNFEFFSGTTGSLYREDSETICTAAFKK